MYKGGRGGPLQQNKMTTDKGGGGKAALCPKYNRLVTKIGMQVVSCLLLLVTTYKTLFLQTYCDKKYNINSK